MDKPTVLVTRPSPTGEILCTQLERFGFSALFLPTMLIIPTQDPEKLTQEWAKLNEIDWLIFVSPNAVSYCLPYLDSAKANWPKRCQIAAVGESTTKALQAAGIKVDAQPQEDWSSEGLLQLAPFKQVTAKNIAIVCGEGGRQHLAQVLRMRGAIVRDWIAYQRKLPVYADLSRYVDLFNQEKIAIIVCTSAEGLSNLCQLFSQEKVLLTTRPLLVVSKRIAAIAQQLGFKRVFVADNATNDAIIKEIIQMSENPIHNDATPAIESEAEVLSENKPPRAKRYKLLSGLVVILIITGMLVMVSKMLVDKSKINHRLTQEIVTMHNQLAVLQKTQLDQSQELTKATDANAQLQEKWQTTSQAVTQLQQAQHDAQSDWQIAEIRYLLKTANNYLHLNGDVETAIKLVTAAQTDMTSLNNPKFNNLHAALTKDLTTLNNTPELDVANIYSRLTKLNAVVTQLPLINKLPSVATPALESHETNTEHLSWWRHGLTAIKNSLQKIIIVHKNSAGGLILTPNDQENFYAAIAGKIDNAQWAVLHRQTSVYNQSLMAIANLTKHYFVQDDAATRQFNDEINSLLTINLQPTQPTLQALLALDDYFKTAADK
jgi:uroporphyrinogen-III synthase